jgi:peptide/nickel transport system permease protein
VIRYTLARLLQAIPLLLGVLVLNFILIHAAPGDPITLLAGQSGDAAYYADMRARYGLDQPVLIQLGRYILNAAQGQFGYSFAYSAPVFQVIVDRIPATLLLTGTAWSSRTWSASGSACCQRDRRADWVDPLVSIGTLVGQALPSFWLGQLLIIVFAAGLGIFPVEGISTVRARFTGLRAGGDPLHVGS